MTMQTIRTTVRAQRGFTLVELLVVIAIIGILAAVAIPKYVDSTASANGAKIKADLMALDSAIQQYAADHQGNLPTQLSDLKNYFSGNTTPTPTAGANWKTKDHSGTVPSTGAVYTLDTTSATTGTTTTTPSGRAMFDTYTADTL